MDYGQARAECAVHSSQGAHAPLISSGKGDRSTSRGRPEALLTLGTPTQFYLVSSQLGLCAGSWIPALWPGTSIRCKKEGARSAPGSPDSPTSQGARRQRTSKNLVQGHTANSRFGNKGAERPEPLSASPTPHKLPPRLPNPQQSAGVSLRAGTDGWFPLKREGGTAGALPPAPLARKTALSPCGHRDLIVLGREEITELGTHLGIGRKEHLGEETHFRNKHTFVPASMFFQWCKNNNNNNKGVPNLPSLYKISFLWGKTGRLCFQMICCS